MVRLRNMKDAAAAAQQLAEMTAAGLGLEGQLTELGADQELALASLEAAEVLPPSKETLVQLLQRSARMQTEAPGTPRHMAPPLLKHSLRDTGASNSIEPNLCNAEHPTTNGTFAATCLPLGGGTRTRTGDPAYVCGEPCRTELQIMCHRDMDRAAAALLAPTGWLRRAACGLRGP